jgi:hypothetical protein
MKYSALIAVLVALAPTSIHAQNPQVSDCRTLQATGNFIASDEALVNGLVCKASKPKTNWTAVAQTTGKSAEGSLALLGILTPETLRSKETGAKAPGGEPAPGTTSGPAQSNSAAGGGPQKSLGEIARAYRKEAGVRISTESEQGNPEPKGLGDAKVDRVAIAPETDKTAIVTTIQRPLPRATPQQASSVPEPTSSATKTGKVTAATTAPSSAASVAPQVAKTEVITVPQAKASPMDQESNPGAPTPLRGETAVKQETTLPVIGVKSASAPDVQAQVRAAMPASTQRTPTNALTAASAHPSAAVATHESKPELLSTVGSLAVASAANASPVFEANNNKSDEDAAFREGQGPTCRKNVSLGSMDKDKLFLAIPVWALQWLEKNQKRFPGICFSDSLMPGAKNYLVVFYVAAPPAAATTASKNISALGEMTPASGIGSFTTSYGSTWHYTYDRAVTTTITSASAEKAPHNQSSGLLYATAYSEQGIPISHHSPAGVTKQVKETPPRKGKRDDAKLAEFRPFEELCEKMIKDIAKL